MSSSVISLVVAQCETHVRQMREMRNAFAHDYPEQRAAGGDTEPGFSAADRLVGILQHVK